MKKEYQFIVKDIYGDQKPRILYRKNSNNKRVFCFLDWNTEESEEGWSREEVESMISVLKNTLEYTSNINSIESTEFLFNPIRDL